jgi:hypothetical protein
MNHMGHGVDMVVITCWEWSEEELLYLGSVENTGLDSQLTPRVASCGVLSLSPSPEGPFKGGEIQV